MMGNMMCMIEIAILAEMIGLGAGMRKGKHKSGNNREAAKRSLQIILLPA